MSKRALLVVDAQRVYTDETSDLYCKNAAETIRRINDLIRDAERRADLIVLIRHEHKVDGSDLGRMFDFSGTPEDDFNFKRGSGEVQFDGSLRVPKKAVQITKSRYSSFVGTELESVLRKNSVNTVVICGFMTNFCCDSTARSAHDLDFYVDFISDATGTPGTDKQTQNELRQRVADMLAAGIARCWQTSRWLKR